MQATSNGVPYLNSHDRYPIMYDRTPKLVHDNVVDIFRLIVHLVVIIKRHNRGWMCIDTIIQRCRWHQPDHNGIFVVQETTIFK